jgi:hypothetical protein
MRFSAEEFKRINEEAEKNAEIEKVKIVLEGVSDIFVATGKMMDTILKDAMFLAELYNLEEHPKILAEKLGITEEKAHSFTYALTFQNVKDGKAGLGLYYSDNTGLFYRVYIWNDRLPLKVDVYDLEGLKKLYKEYEPFLKGDEQE